MRSLPTILTAILALVLAAPLGCSDDAPSEQPDAGPDGGSYDDHIIEGGGTTGGPVDGLLVLWFFDDPSGDPIEGVQVMVGNDSTTALTGTTDADGQVVFEDPSLSGPTDVHYLHDDYPAGSLYGLNATYVTLGPSVIGYDAVPEPDNPTTEHRIALVNFGLPIEDLITGDYEEIEQEEDQLFGVAVNMLAPDMPSGGKNEFSLEVYERVGTLFAAAGIYDSVAATFTTYAIAVDPGFDPSQDSIEDVEIALAFEVAPENTLEVTVDPVPSAYEQVGGSVWFDLGEDGNFSLGVPPVSPGDPIAIRLPDVTVAPFDEANVLFSVYGGQDVEDDDDNFPSGQRLVRDITIDAAIGSGIEIDDLLEPPTDMSWDSSELSLTMPAGISYGGARAENEDEDVLWGATVYDPPADAIALPDFPADWGWNGLPETGLRIYSGAGVIDGDINDAVFDELWYQMFGSTENVIDVD
ncbi:MAG: carboxypeptidase regulatory-like domain-containing protein [Deltaproteobacteria bacterium]|nr:carboxypeptidase regulatory-like domain-containing protein [Deltaproteobacteria bacterium]